MKRVRLQADVDMDVASGFRDDCSQLLQSFAELKTLRYKDFCTLWTSMDMPLIYCGRSIFSELFELAGEVLFIAKQYLVDTDREFQIRVGALYLLFALYQKQPVGGIQKIRMTIEDWQIFKNMQYELRVANHLDALYISCKLEVQRAFLHVVSEHDHAPQKSYRKYHSRPNVACDTHKYSITRPLAQFTIDSGLLDAMQTLNEKYYNAKCVLPGSYGTSPEDALNLVDQDIGKVIKENFDKLTQGEVVTLQKNDSSESPATACSSTSEQESTIGDRRNRIRNKGFTAKKGKSSGMS